MPGFQTLTTLRAHLESAGLTPRKLYGQHFLIDGNLMRKLVASAELTPQDRVLEIGTATGSLTSLLAAGAGHVVTVEIDRKLAEISQQVLAPFANVVQIVGDAMKSKSALSPRVLSALDLAPPAPGGALKLVANLPYDIATSLVMDVLICPLPFARLCFTVQAEVGDRFTAEPGSGSYGSVGILAQTFAHVHRVLKVPPEAFWPRPKVESSMLRLDRRPDREQRIIDRAGFARFVRSFFLHRRKTLSHLAKKEADSARLLSALSGLGIDPKARPEEISVSQWQSLFLAAC